MTPYEYVKNHVNVKLSPSKIHGVGIFAIRDIEENEDLFVNWTGDSGVYFINEDDMNTLNLEVKEHLFDMFKLKKVDNKSQIEIVLNKNCHWIFKTPYHWLNSCSWDSNPNVNRETLKATKRIKCGEELLTKYGKYEKFRQNKII